MPPGSAGVSAAQCAHYRPLQQLLSVPRGKISVTLMISADVYIDFRYLRARNQLMTHIGDSPNSLCSRWVLSYANQPVWWSGVKKKSRYWCGFERLLGLFVLFKARWRNFADGELESRTRRLSIWFNFFFYLYFSLLSASATDLSCELHNDIIALSAWLCQQTGSTRGWMGWGEWSNVAQVSRKQIEIQEQRVCSW